jgi:ATP-dependent DNA helicase RecQ
MVFHDATLRLMATLQPRSESELLGISGVGQTKLANYGEAFLAVIRDYANGGASVFDGADDFEQIGV